MLYASCFMILSDRDIKLEIEKGNIVIKPQPDYTEQLSSCSLDLKLGREFRVFQYSVMPYIDIKKEIPDSLTSRITLKNDEPFILQPGEFVLASTAEWVELSSKIAARLEGRSSIGRLGVIVHATASVISPGWAGNITLELANIGRMAVALHPGMRICALSFEYLTSEAEVPYNKNKMSKYVGQSGVATSKIDSEM